MRYKEKTWGKIRVREREHLSTSREACMLEVYRRRKKKIKHVNKTWPYLVHPMMLLGGRRKKKT